MQDFFHQQYAIMSKYEGLKTLPFRRRKRFGEICWANSHSSLCTDVSPSNVDEVIIPRVSKRPPGSLWFRVATTWRMFELELLHYVTWWFVYIMFLYIYVCIYIYVHIFIYIYMTCIYTYFKIYTYIYIYICTGIHKFSPTIPFLFTAFFRKTRIHKLREKKTKTPSGTSSSPRAAPGWHHRAWKPTRLGRSTFGR